MPARHMHMTFSRAHMHHMVICTFLSRSYAPFSRAPARPVPVSRSLSSAVVLRLYWRGVSCVASAVPPLYFSFVNSISSVTAPEGILRLLLLHLRE